MRGRRRPARSRCSRPAPAGRAAPRGSRPRREAVADSGLGQMPPGERGGRAFRDDPAGHDHRDPVGEKLRLVHEVRGEQHGHTERRQVPDHLPCLVPRRGVEAGGRLVEEQQFWIADQRDRDVQPPLLAAGELVHADCALLFEADEADHIVDRPGTGIEGRIHGDRLAHREIPVDARRLQHDPCAGLQSRPLTAGIAPEHADLAVVAGAVALENLDGCRLARTIRAEQREDLADADREVDALDSLRPGVGLHQTVNVHRQRARLAGCDGAGVGGRQSPASRAAGAPPSERSASGTEHEMQVKMGVSRSV